MADIVKRSGSVLARGRSGFLTGVQNAMAGLPQGPSDPILRLLKSGKWVFGQNSEEVQRGSRWVVRTWEVTHGFCSWTNDSDEKNVLKGEVMVPINQHLPDEAALPHTGYPWKPQFLFPMTCLTGADRDTMVIYKTPSYGALKAARGLLATIVERMGELGEDYDFNCPVIQLDTNSYQHKKWGETFEPILTLMGWADTDGNPDTGAPVIDEEGFKVINPDEAPFEPDEVLPPKKKATAKPAKPPLDEPEEVAPAPASAARAGAPRRRPAGRASA